MQNPPMFRIIKYGYYPDVPQRSHGDPQDSLRNLTRNPNSGRQKRQSNNQKKVSETTKTPPLPKCVILKPKLGWWQIVSLRIGSLHQNPNLNPTVTDSNRLDRYTLTF